ncbi:hypothetical protein BOX15_Mlig001981g2 [Macrostomum lignano]|uniref:Uncharacterized protein n=2 Tax=Macrostomum lignano TaxID=282301 RepID=A0A267DT84_9PLAT|nr:hypothetical protein BOX15_Mlig001981g2 [Macrostomum lignano]
MPVISERQPQLRPDQVRAQGPGIGVPEAVPLAVGQPAPFTLDTRNTNGPPELVAAAVYNPRGDPIPLDMRQQAPGLLQCSYVPQEPGKHTATVSYAGVSTSGSPFRAFVAEPVRPDLVQASGPGLERAVRNQPTFFNIDCSRAGPGDVGVGVRAEPSGQELPVKTSETGPGQFRVDYTPVQVVPHLVNVMFAGQPAAGGPFRVPVDPDIEVDKVRVDGLEPTIPLGVPHEFDILTGGNPRAPVSVRVRPPAGPPIQPLVSETVDGYAVEFTPSMPGPHTVEVEFAGRRLPQSPMRTNVVPQQQPVDEALMSPRKQAPMQHQQQPYQQQQPQFGAPQQVAPQRAAPQQQQQPQFGAPQQQQPQFGAPQQQQPQFGAPQQQQPQFGAPQQVAPQRAAPQQQQQQPQFGAPQRAAPQQQQPVMEEMIGPQRQTPKQSAGYAPQPIAIAPYDSSMALQKAVPGSQGPPPNVRAYGDGLSKAATGIPARFTIDSRDAPNIPLGVNVEGPSKADIRCQDNGDGTADVDYTVTEPGQYKVNVLAVGQHVSGSPFTVTAVRSGYEGVDPKKVRAFGPGLQPHGVFRESFAKFTVDASALDRSGKGQVSGVVNAPSKQRSAARVENKGNGMYECSYCPLEEGPYQVEVLYEGLHVMGSPFPVKVSNGCDPRRVRAFGPGLQGGFADEPAEFTVELGTAGQGGLSLAVEGPSEAPIQCKDNKDGTCSVQYTPSESGMYDVVVKFADVDIPGSPFPVRIEAKTAPNKVTAYGPGLETGKVRQGVPATFTVDASRAGPGQLAATVTQAGQTKPCAATQAGQPGLYSVGYTPDREGPTKVNVMYAGQQVPKSPFSVHTLPKCEPHKVVVTGEGVRSSGVLASLPTEFCIDTTEAGEGDLQVTIEDSEGRPVAPRIEPQKSGVYLCKYTPADVGRYTVGVKYGGVEVPESPYHVRTEPTGDAEKVKMVVPPESSVPAHQEAIITVDTSDAGTGKVTCRIRAPNDSELDIDLEENDDGTVSLYYTPRQPGMQTIEIKFGGQVIPNGEIKQEVLDDFDGVMQDLVEEVGAKKAVPSSLQPSDYHPVDFKLPVGPVFARVEGLIRTPNGRTARPTLDDNGDGTVTFKYLPTERGMHELTVRYNDQPIPGSPFKFFVESVGTGHVTAYGPGLSHGRTGEPAEFCIVTKDAGAGGLALAIEGPSRAEINCNDNKDGTCSVNYLPLAPGDYTIVVKFMERHIPGSPFTARITGEPRRRAEVSVGQANEIPLKITETDISGLTASITGPDGIEEPCVLKRLPNGHLGISFTPKQVGEHQVGVNRAGRHIPNSPFRIDVSESDIGDAQRVRVSGRGLEEGMAGQANAFTVDTPQGWLRRPVAQRRGPQ